MREEKGFGLIIAVIATAFMMLLGLSVSLSSISHFAISNDLEKQKIASNTADAAYNTVKETLRGQDIDGLLQTTTYVPQYIYFTPPQPGTPAHEYYSRNPLPPVEAVHLNFDSPPEPIGFYALTGMLTPAEGTTFGSGGKFWAKLTDNDDGDGDATVDGDGLVYVRTLAIQQTGAGQVSSYGRTVRNSLAIIEAQLKRDMTFDASAPVTISGPGIGSNFDGTSFIIDGYNHSGWPTSDILSSHSHSSGSGSSGIDFVYDNPGGSPADGAAARNTVKNSLTNNQGTNVIGPESDYGSNEPALRDHTAGVRNDTNPDATNLFDPDFLASLISRMSNVADDKYPPNTDLSGSGVELGTDENPKITVAEGDFSISGNGSGAGILVVKGNLSYTGGFQYRGLVLVSGGGAGFAGVNKSIIGGFFLFDLQGPDVYGNYSFGVPDLDVQGNSHFYYSGQDVQIGFSRLPMKTISWREVPPELDPAY